MNLWVHPSIRCPVCQAAPRRPCVDGELTLTSYHLARVQAENAANVLRAAEEMKP